MKILLFSIISILLYPNLFGQRFDYPIKEFEPAKLSVTYILEYVEDTLFQEFVRQDDMLLIIGDDMSKFVSKDYYIFDNRMRTISSPEEFQLLISGISDPISVPRCMYQIFKDFETGSIQYFERVMPNNFMYVENLNLFDWKVTGDTSSCIGYKTFKATCSFGGRNWIAWFCPDIPYNDGPYKFNGLPGLILKIHDTKNHYVFNAIKIEKLTGDVILDFTDKGYIEISKQEFIKAEEVLKENMVTMAKEAGINVSERAHQEAKRRAAERNNPIELLWD